MLSTHNTVPQLLQVAVMSIPIYMYVTKQEVNSQMKMIILLGLQCQLEAVDGADADLAGQSINIAS